MTSLQTDCFKCQGKGWVYVRNNFDPTGGDVVPDPYHGDAEDFEEVIKRIESSAQAWIESWKTC